ncbi:hypothetical protein SprV_0100110400 [Sparganum proliferum]
MQNFRTPLQVSIRNSEDCQDPSGDKSFLQEFQSFHSAVFGTNFPDDDGSDFAQVKEPSNTSNNRQESSKGSLNTLDKNCHVICSNNRTVDSVDQVEEFTDLDEDSCDPLPLVGRTTDTANDTDVSCDEIVHAQYSENHTPTPSKTSSDDNPASAVAAPLVPTIYPQPRRLQRSVALLSRDEEDSDIEVVNPHKTLLTAQEDPIATHDTLVARMAAAGVEWVPPDQKTKKTAHVRWFAPQVEEVPAVVTSSVPTNVNENHSANATTVISSTSDNKLKEPDRTAIRANMSASKSNVQLDRVPSSTPSSIPVGGAETKLRDLETQLQKEQATRRQQDDYIRQLQKYYDNLLAKHALAEMTIDQLRLVAKVGGISESGPLSRRSDSRATLPDAILPGSDSLRPRPMENHYRAPTAPGSLRRQQGGKSSSVSFLPLCSLPTAPSDLQAGSTRSDFRINAAGQDAASRQDTSPQMIVHAPRRPKMLSASTDQLLSQQRLSLEEKRTGHAPNPSLTSTNGAAFVSESSAGQVPNPPRDSSSSRHRGATTTPQPSTSDSETANAEASSLLAQLRFALALIDEKLADFERQSKPCGTDRRRLLDVLTEELEELQRTYQSAQFLWASGSGFDNDRQIQNQMLSLASRLSATTAASAAAPENRVNRRLSFDSSSPECGIGTAGVRERPSTLASTNDSQPASSDSAVYSQPNSSASPPELNDTLQSRLETRSGRESAELHFIRLLSRYNEVKARTWDATIMKELESLMQRLLQLSDRYSLQSSVILPPKDLRAMFQLDQESNRLSEQLGNTLSGERTVFVNRNHIVFDRTSTAAAAAAAENSLSRKFRPAENTKANSSVLTPDSGLPTPPASCLGPNEFFGSPTLSPSSLKTQHQQQTSACRRLPPDVFRNVKVAASGGRLSDGDICPTDSGVGAASGTGYHSRPSSARLRDGETTDFQEFKCPYSRPTDTDGGIASCSELQAPPDSRRSSQPGASEDGLRYGSRSLHYHSKSASDQTDHSIDLMAHATLPRSPSQSMLIRDTISLEEDIRRLRRSVARLNGLNSVTSLDSTGRPCSARSSAGKSSRSDMSSPQPASGSGGPEPWQKKGVPTSKFQSSSISKVASQRLPYQHTLGNFNLGAPSNSSSDEEPHRRQAVKVLPRRLRPIKVSAPGADTSDNDMAVMQVVGVGIRPRPYDSSSLPSDSGCVLRTYQKHASASARRCRPSSRRDHSVGGLTSTSRIGLTASVTSQCSVLPVGRQKHSRNRLTCRESCGTDDVLADPPAWGGSMPSLAAAAPTRSCCELGAPRTAIPPSARRRHDFHRSQSSFQCCDSGTKLTASGIRGSRGVLPCNSCGGSGYLRNCSNCEADQPTPVISNSQCVEHSTSDQSSPPVRVVYKYTQPCIPVIMSSVRLPVRHYETWTERVYDVHEFDVTPQTQQPTCKPDCPINKPIGAFRVSDRRCRLSHRPSCYETPSPEPLRMSPSNAHRHSAFPAHKFSPTSSPSPDSDNSQQPIVSSASRIKVSGCPKPGARSHSAFRIAKSDTRVAHCVQTGLSATPAATRKKCFCDLDKLKTEVWCAVGRPDCGSLARRFRPRSR